MKKLIYIVLIFFGLAVSVGAFPMGSKTRAEHSKTDTTNFGGILSTEETVQEALDAIDDIDFGDLGEVSTILGNWVNTANPWADNEVADALSLDALNLNKLTSAPGTPLAGEVYYADQVTWDPSGLGAVGAYYCIYDGADYIALFDEDGGWYIGSIELPSYSHYATGDAVYSDTSTPHVLTAAELKGSIITNCGASGDTVYTMPDTEFGMNFMVVTCHTTVSRQMNIDPHTDEQLWLNGTQMDANENIVNAADTKGQVMSCWSMESGDGTYELFCKSDDSNWAQATP